MSSSDAKAGLPSLGTVIVYLYMYASDCGVTIGSSRSIISIVWQTLVGVDIRNTIRPSLASLKNIVIEQHHKARWAHNYLTSIVRRYTILV